MTDSNEYANAAEALMDQAENGAELFSPEVRQIRATLALTNAVMLVASVLAQIRDTLVLTNELIAADPAISHVIATRQIITEMRESQSVNDEEDEEEETTDAPQTARGALN